MDEIIIVDFITWEPSIIFGIQWISWFKGVEHSTVNIEDLLQVSIHFRVGEESLTEVAIHDSEK